MGKCRRAISTKSSHSRTPMMHNLMLVRRPPNRHPVMTIPSSTTWAPPAKQRDLMVPGAVTPLPERPGLRWTPMVLQGSAEKVDQDGIATQIVQGTGPAPGHDNTQLDGGLAVEKEGFPARSSRISWAGLWQGLLATEKSWSSMAGLSWRWFILIGQCGTLWCPMRNRRLRMGQRAAFGRGRWRMSARLGFCLLLERVGL